MKVGDQVPVTIAGQTVVMADVKELGEGTATLIVPATRVVMATRTELTADTANLGGGVELLTDRVADQPPADNPEQAVLPPQPVPNEAAVAAPPANTEPVAAPVEPVVALAPEAPAETSSE